MLNIYFVLSLLNALDEKVHLILTTVVNIDPLVISILHMKKLRHTEFKKPVQDHRGNK